MVSFIICEKEDYMRKVYRDIIQKFFIFRNDFYKIFEYDLFSNDILDKVNHVDGMKIYLINIDRRNNRAFDLIRNIRRYSEDFVSPIILITEKDKTYYKDELSNIMFLDIIVQNASMCTMLYRAIQEAYRISTSRKTYMFSIFDEVYRLPYDSICYIEKNTKEDSVTIHTKDDSYTDYISVKGISKKLSNDPRFFKSHRSCIINLFNVESYDKKSNKIIFNNGSNIDKVSRTNKSILIKKLEEFAKVD